MNGEGRLPTTLVVSIIIIIAAVGIAAYFAGRFGRSPRVATADRLELPDPAAPAPALVETVATPADIPPTVTPPLPVVIEKTTQSKVLVERSSQIVVPVGPAPTARPVAVPVELGQPAPAGKRIVVEVRPTPTPTVPEVELRAPPPPVATPIAPPQPELPPEEAPDPEPEPTARPAAPAVLTQIREVESSRELPARVLLSRSSPKTRGGADRPIGC